MTFQAQILWLNIKQRLITNCKKFNLTFKKNKAKLNRKTRALRKSINKKFIAKSNIFVKSKKYWQALCWQYLYSFGNWVHSKKRNNVFRISLALFLLLGAFSYTLVPNIQAHLQQYLSESNNLQMVKELFLNLGTALIGATAFAFSLIMFAMQVNVERMPHGLFIKFSSDVKLLTYFLATFTLACLTGGLSLIPDAAWVAAAGLTSFWWLLLILLLFGLAYRRALDLISPTKQLELLVINTKKTFKKWDKAAKRAAPIFQKIREDKKDDTGLQNKHDLDRIQYFKLYPNWTSFAAQAIFYCISFARRYSEQGDHEVSRSALFGVVSINAEYIITKGKTFFTNASFFENPLTSDGFISETLEHIRQNIQIGIARKDEQFIEQNFQCLTQLTHLYLTMDYGDEHADKYHAHLAAGYLTSAVESIIPHDMADVLIEGVTQIGKAAQLIIQYDKPQFIASLSDKIGMVACAGAINRNYQVVTPIAVKQLATITFDLLRCNSTNISYAAKEVRADVKFIAEVFLNIEDSALTSIHSRSLAPYYSSTSMDALSLLLTNLTNALLTLDKKNKDARRIIRHLSEWSDGIYRTEKELLLKAIEKRSQFTFDLVHWIVHLTKVLLTISSAEACDSHHGVKLRESAIWLISVLSWIPEDEETIRYIGNYQIAENLFESTLDAHNCNCIDEALKIRKLLVGWMQKSGKYQTGWANLETACFGLACLNLILELPDELLLQEIIVYVSNNNAPNFEIRSRAASEIHNEAEKFHGSRGLGAIDHAMSQVDQSRLRLLLHKIADHLLPEAINPMPVDQGN